MIVRFFLVEQLQILLKIMYIALITEQFTDNKKQKLVIKELIQYLNPTSYW